MEKCVLTPVLDPCSVILDDDMPIARLERVDPAQRGDDRLARLESAGIIRRGSGAAPLEQLRRAPPRAKRSLVQALRDEHDEGR